MQQVRGASLLLLICVTAVMTPIAALPHFVCRCPNGQVKLYCIGSTSKPDRCCCAGECCGKSCGCCKERQAALTQPAPTCCGQSSGDHPAAMNNHVAGDCCSRSVAQSQPSSVSDRQIGGIQDLAFARPFVLALDLMLIQTGARE